MAGMKVSEIRDLESPTLLEQIESKRQELFNLRIQWNTGSLENPNQMHIVRKDIARILTVLRERELAVTFLQDEPSQLARLEPVEPAEQSQAQAEPSQVEPGQIEPGQTELGQTEPGESTNA